MRNKSKKLMSNVKGITLIALVITIIVLLILAGVAILSLTGENGVLNKSVSAKTKNVHATVYEALRLEANSYAIEKNTGSEETLIQYLQRKKIIDSNGIINVENLLGSKQSLGNGTSIESGDVYVLKQKTKEIAKIATTEVIKVAEASKEMLEYEVIYYGKTESENTSLGFLIQSEARKDLVEPDNKYDWEYTVNEADNTITLNLYKGKATEVVIPNHIGGIPVVALDGKGENGSIWANGICDETEEGYTKIWKQNTITKVTFSNSISDLGSNTFRNSCALKEVKLPIDGVETIKDHMFYGCINLSSINLPKGLKKIEEGAFYKCELMEELTIPDTVETIDSWAFDSIGSLRINIPSSVHVIGDLAFQGGNSSRIIYCDFVEKPNEWSQAWRGYTGGPGVVGTVKWLQAEKGR